MTNFGYGDQGYNTYVKVLAVIIISIFYLSYVMTVGTTTWIYIAETLLPKSLRHIILLVSHNPHHHLIPA